MKKLLLLLALGLGFAMVYPQHHEHTPTACAALDQRLTQILAAALPPRGHQPSDGLSGDLGREIGAQAKAYARSRFALLPPEASCVVAYWGTLLKPGSAAAVFRSYLAGRSPG
jgi:hypothetical protein